MVIDKEPNENPQPKMVSVNRAEADADFDDEQVEMSKAEAEADAKWWAENAEPDDLDRAARWLAPMYARFEERTEQRTSEELIEDEPGLVDRILDAVDVRHGRQDKKTLEELGIDPEIYWSCSFWDAFDGNLRWRTARRGRAGNR